MILNDISFGCFSVIFHDIIWTNNGRIHLRQTNDSKVITIRHEKDLEQIEKPTTDSGNLYGP